MVRTKGMHCLTGVFAAFALAGSVSAQGLLDATAAMGVADTLGAEGASGGLNPSLYQGRANAAVGAANANNAAMNTAIGGAPPGGPAPGFVAPPPSGAIPGLPPPPGDAGPGAGIPGLSAPAGQGFTPDQGMGGGMPGMPGMPGDPSLGGAPGAPTPTPIPTIKVLVGKRVYDAVTGSLLEDAIAVSIYVTEQDQYLDDGIHDNGIAGDGIRGNVVTMKDMYIGAETNGIKNRLIRVVRDSEAMSPMQFFRHHVATTDPRNSNPAMPNLLTLEKQRDDLLQDWNGKFLADYRIEKDNPQSEFFQLYVPKSPRPPQFRPPAGYVAPQKLEAGAVPVLQAPPPVAPGPNIYNGEAVIGVPGMDPETPI